MLVGEEKVEVVMVQVLDHDWPQNLRCGPQIFTKHLREPATVVRTEDVTVREAGKDSALSVREVILVRRDPTVPGRDNCLRRNREQTTRK